MKKLYAPWRRGYAHKVETDRDKNFNLPCIFCTYAACPKEDENNLVLTRGLYTFVMLNLYPYNGGHLLIAPYTHADSLGKLEREARIELIESANVCAQILQHELHPNGFNIGMNLGGKAAGGSIPEHLHVHVLPRWHGDTSFLPTLADTKPISENLLLLYAQLKKAFTIGKPSKP
jgi:ATP adenylyltransferase